MEEKNEGKRGAAGLEESKTTDEAITYYTATLLQPCNQTFGPDKQPRGVK